MRKKLIAKNCHFCGNGIYYEVYLDEYDSLEEAQEVLRELVLQDVDYEEEIIEE